MVDLYKKHCEICRTGSPVVTGEEANGLLLTIPLWRLEIHDGVEKLIREFQFIDFKDAFGFTHKLANLSEREQHHPTIVTEWGKVTVYWWTHKINGLHLNDFIMAARSDKIADLFRH